MVTLSKSGSSLYIQLSKELEKRIRSGEFKVNDKLPTDSALCAEYGVSVITVKAAMQILVQKNLVSRSPGRNTIVLSDDGIQDDWGLGSIADLVLTGLKSKLVLLERTFDVPPAWVSNKLNIPRATKVYKLLTTRETRGQRFTVTELYHPLHIGQLIESEKLLDQTSQSKLVISVVQEVTGLKPAEVHQTMTAGLADKSDASHVGIREGDPILIIDRDYYAEDGQLLQVGRSKYRVDRYSYRLNLSRFDASRQTGNSIED